MSLSFILTVLMMLFVFACSVPESPHPKTCAHTDALFWSVHVKFWIILNILIWYCCCISYNTSKCWTIFFYIHSHIHTIFKTHVTYIQLHKPRQYNVIFSRRLYFFQIEMQKWKLRIPKSLQSIFEPRFSAYYTKHLENVSLSICGFYWYIWGFKGWAMGEGCQPFESVVPVNQHLRSYMTFQSNEHILWTEFKFV